MLQVRKSHFCGISAIFLQCCFISETQVIMTVSNFFWGFFSMINFLEGCFTFQWGASFFSGGCLMEGGGINFDGGILKKKIMWWRGGTLPCSPPPLWETLHIHKLQHLECLETSRMFRHTNTQIATFRIHSNIWIQALQLFDIYTATIRMFNNETFQSI